MSAAPTDWSVRKAFVVTLPSIGPDGKPGPAARLVVATEARAREVAEAHPLRSWREVTEADLTPTELANLRRAASPRAAAF